MPKHTYQSAATRPYAQSLLELTQDNAQAQSIGQELGDLAIAIEQDPTLKNFFTNPAVGIIERATVLERAFKSRLSPLLYNFIGVLNRKLRLALLPQISQTYDELLDERLGKVEVDVITAARLTNDQLERVRQKVSQALKREAVVHQYVDEKIIGGIVLRVADKLIDASVRYQLESLRHKLLETKLPELSM